MSNQHTDNHNDALTFYGALLDNDVNEGIVDRRNRVMDEAALTPIPWKQIHRANVPHLSRRSN
jgi:hypothetical protein